MPCEAHAILDCSILLYSRYGGSSAQRCLGDNTAMMARFHIYFPATGNIFALIAAWRLAWLWARYGSPSAQLSATCRPRLPGSLSRIELRPTKRHFEGAICRASPCSISRARRAMPLLCRLCAIPAPLDSNKVASVSSGTGDKLRMGRLSLIRPRRHANSRHAARFFE